MVKTHISLTDNPNLKGVPKGWRLRVRDILTKGAGFELNTPGSRRPAVASVSRL